jgi:kynurenine formamidase
MSTSADPRRIIDITGPVHDGMWSYGEPFPQYHLQQIPTPAWLSYPIYSESFIGLCSQTGTYLETPAHLLGYRKSYPLARVPVEKLVDIPTCVIQVDRDSLPIVEGRRAITREALTRRLDSWPLSSCRAVLVSTAWGRAWRKPDFVTGSPFFMADAMDWLIGLKPFLLGSDSPRWESLERPQGFVPAFFGADILMLAPCVNLEEIRSTLVTLTVLPLKIEDTCCTPCRAVVSEPLRNN